MVTPRINVIWFNPETNETEKKFYNFFGAHESWNGKTYEQVRAWLNKKYPPWIAEKWWNEGAEEPGEKLSLWDYMVAVIDVQAKYKDWRKGQTYFNVLSEMRPDLSEAIRGSSWDPFHNDELCDDFLFFVVTSWNNDPATQYNIVEWMKINLNKDGVKIS